MLATCSTDKMVNLWDTYGSGNRGIGGTPVHCGSKDMGVGKLYSVGFYSSSPWLLGCAGAGKELAIWDMTREESLRNRFNGRATVTAGEVQEKLEKSSSVPAQEIFGTNTNESTIDSSSKTNSKGKKKQKKKQQKKKAHKAGR